jgi:UDP-N-acetylmuramate--alanine ligase
MKMHFIGIGGKGMSSIAQYVKKLGHEITGSDRYYDRGEYLEIFEKLMLLGIKIYPQDGSGISQDTTRVIVSSAIEKSNPDLMKALELSIPVGKRAELLAEIFNTYSNSMAIGGTSGKTTVAGMLATLLQEAGLMPTAFLGGELICNYHQQFTGNLLVGGSNYLCIEADESDGTIVYYRPKIGVITNISKDHQEVSELIPLFQKFADNITDTLVINGDCPNCAKIKFPKQIITFGFGDNCTVQARDVVVGQGKLEFKVDETTYHINLWGRHNVENTLAAIGVAAALRLSPEITALSLSRFKGMKRRLELAGIRGGVVFFDDYAHNPKKIQASILALRDAFPRLIMLLQCHGYQPTSFMWDELVDTFATTCRKGDLVIIPPIYDVGGTATRAASAVRLAEALTAKGVNGLYFPCREKAGEFIRKVIVPGDSVLVMGARDETLSKFVRELKDNM